MADREWPDVEWADVYLVDFENADGQNLFVVLVSKFEDILHLNELQRGKLFAIKHLEDLYSEVDLDERPLTKCRVVDLRPSRRKK